MYHRPGEAEKRGVAAPGAENRGLNRRAAVSQAQELMAQADAEDRFLAAQVANRLDAVTDRRRISRAIGKENAVRAMGEDLLCAGRSRHDRDPAAHLDQASEEIPLLAESDIHDIG